MARSDLNREAIPNQPDRITANTNGLVDRHWPRLTETGLENRMSDLMDVSTPTGNGKENEKLPASKASASVSAAGAGAESKFKSGTLAASALGSPLFVGISNAGVELARIYKDWNPGNFIDVFTGEYVCACGKRCLTKEAFETHVLAESQGARRMQCPNCLKIFKSTAAIITHWESPSLKCDQSEADMYAQIVDEVSGGLIHIAGYNEDGTIRYEASNLELHKTKTIGVALDRIDW